jgi:hypothetical protein
MVVLLLCQSPRPSVALTGVLAAIALAGFGEFTTIRRVTI